MLRARKATNVCGVSVCECCMVWKSGVCMQWSMNVCFHTEVVCCGRRKMKKYVISSVLKSLSGLGYCIIIILILTVFAGIPY